MVISLLYQLVQPLPDLFNHLILEVELTRHWLDPDPEFRVIGVDQHLSVITPLPTIVVQSLE
jgi:hypothetical protein